MQRVFTIRDLFCSEVVDATDVGVADATRELNLCHQSPYSSRTVAHRGHDRLQRNAFSQRAVVRLVDLTHATARDEPLDAVTVGQNRPCAQRTALWITGCGFPASSAD